MALKLFRLVCASYHSTLIFEAQTLLYGETAVPACFVTSHGLLCTAVRGFAVLPPSQLRGSSKFRTITRDKSVSILFPVDIGIVFMIRSDFCLPCVCVSRQSLSVVLQIKGTFFFSPFSSSQSHVGVSRSLPVVLVDVFFLSKSCSPALYSSSA